MQLRNLPIVVVTMFLLMPAVLFGQVPNQSEQLRYQRALQELEGVIVDSVKLDDPHVRVTVRSKAASLVWRYDRRRAQALFLELWKYIDQQSSDSFNKDEARTALLRILYPLDSILAMKLLKEISDQAKNEKPSLRTQATGNDPNLRRLANLSESMVDEDLVLAARLLEQSLSLGVTPTALSALARIRERNPLLANYVVTQTLEHLKRRPTIVALVGLHLLTDYIFPSRQDSSESTEVRSSNETLRVWYFSSAYEVLRKSLQEPDSILVKEQGYTENDLRFRAIYQGQIAAILAALAPQYGPPLVEELNVIARRLSGGMPPNAANIAQYVVARISGDQSGVDNPDTAIALAIEKADFDEARRLIDKLEDEGRKKAFLQVLARAEFKVRLAESDFTEALNIARRVDNINLRVMLLLQLAKAGYRKDDSTFSRVIVGEARSALLNGDKDGMRARVLLTFASEVQAISGSDAIELLHSAVSMINSLSKTNDEAPSEINDPLSLVDSPELQRAFSLVARADFDGTLLAAGRINPIPVQLMARLATSEVAIRKNVKKPKTAPVKQPAAPTPVKRAP